MSEARYAKVHFSDGTDRSFKELEERAEAEGFSPNAIAAAGVKYAYFPDLNAHFNVAEWVKEEGESK